MFLLKLAGDLEAGKKNMDKTLFTSCGHDWHWTEVFFLFMAATGFGLTAGAIVSAVIPPALPALCLVLTAALGTGYTWNMCTAKRIGMAGETLEIVVHDIAKQNERLRATTGNMKANNEEFTERLELLENSRVTLGRSVMSVEKVVQKQEHLLKQTEDIVAKRRGFQKQLQDLTRAENEFAARQAQLNFEEKVLAMFDMICDGTTLHCGDKLSELRGLLAADGIEWTPDMTDAFASNDMTKGEFSSMMRMVLGEHLGRLNDAVLETRALKRRDRMLTNSISRLKEEIAKKTYELNQEKLMKIHEGNQSNISLPAGGA